MITKLLLIIMSGLLILSGCQRNQHNPTEIVARVGDAYLTRDVVLHFLPKDIDAQQKKFFIRRIVEQWIDNQILAQKALQEGYTLSELDQWKLENLKVELLAAQFISSKTQQHFTVTDREIEEYYQNHQEEFRRDYDEVHLVHLFLEELDNTLVKEIRDSKSLIEVIQKNYLDQRVTPVLEPNGDLGYVIKDRLRPEFKRAIRGTKTGLIYGPIRTKDGYHYLQVLDRQPAGSIRTLDLVKDDIRLRLEAQKRHEYIKMLKESLRKDFTVETFYENIL
ncbi:MAG: hypothetical protein D6748_11890 [Calditrichaeota bacterium]|nr:MAG: hypothetical protein D6748_11890 [Calditrichota bacterium]